MQEHSSKMRSRAAKLLGGALIGTVLSISAVADSASAASKPSSTIVDGGTTDDSTVRAMSSGIRW
jgi:hypothetical protein